jgi:hypothetical protein
MPVFEHTYDEPGSRYGKFPAGLNSAFCRLDLRLWAAVERFGRIDVVVNNAGRGLAGAVEEVPDAAPPAGRFT